MMWHLFIILLLCFSSFRRQINSIYISSTPLIFIFSYLLSLLHLMFLTVFCGTQGPYNLKCLHLLECSSASVRSLSWRAVIISCLIGSWFGPESSCYSGREVWTGLSRSWWFWAQVCCLLTSLGFGSGWYLSSCFHPMTTFLHQLVSLKSSGWDSEERLVSR